ncbi:MAG: Protein GrpE [candidate division TM6 bacterium GW2011_GWF2_28_16]|nr:MAG: Protein GrpE [candidate division TM6 bacterium GW2011_GWF2_28_16]
MVNDEQIKDQELNQEQDLCKLELDKLKTQLLRTNADFDNFKKRVTKERAEWEELARANIIEEFLPVFDDLERAITSIKKETENTKISAIDGLDLIYKNLNKVLDSLGVNEVDCSGAFDPELHEALMQVESDSFKHGQIVQVLAKGYTFNNKVIRHAKVSVAK